MTKFLSRPMIVIALLLLAAPLAARAEDEATDATTAITVQRRHLSINDLKRRLLARFGREHVAYWVRNHQLRRAAAAAKVAVDDAALAKSREAADERLERGNVTKEEFLKARRLTEADYERIVYNGAAAPLVMEAEGVRTGKLLHFLAATQIVKPIVEPDADVYMTIGGDEVTVDELFTGFGELLDDEQVRRVVEDSIREAAVDAELATRDVIVSPTDIDREYARQEREFARRFGTKVSFEQFLRQRGSDEASHRTVLRRVLGLRAVVLTDVTQEQLEAHLKEHLDHFGLAEVRACHILIGVDRDASDDVWLEARARAAEIVEQLRAGGDFAALAKEHSDDSASKFSGGDIGSFPRRGRMMEPFAAAAFALEKGAISDPVRTPLGWHVIKVVERKPPSRVRLSEIREDVVIDYARQKGDEWSKKLAAEAEARVLWEFLQR